MINSDEFIHTAFNIAKKVKPVGSSRIAALVVLKNKIIGIGFNHLRSHPFQLKFARNKESIFFHAEVHAIKQALRSHSDLSNTTLYVARARKVHGNWEYGISKPCEGCQSCIDSYGIKRVVCTGNGETVLG